MIIKNNTIGNFHLNKERTEMLITAMSKIKAYNWLYQQKAYDIHPKHHDVVKEVQDKELSKIEISCSEHAIISLCTNFEVFYKDLLQELLHKYPLFFKKKKTKYQDRIINIISSKQRYNYEKISKELNLNNRFDFIEFLKAYNVNFLRKEEIKIIEHIYIMRNSYVHNAGRLDLKTKDRLKRFPSPTNESYLTTETKRLRTKFNRLITKIYIRIHEDMDKNAE